MNIIDGTTNYSFAVAPNSTSGSICMATAGKLDIDPAGVTITVTVPAGNAGAVAINYATTPVSRALAAINAGAPLIYDWEQGVLRSGTNTTVQFLLPSNATLAQVVNPTTGVVIVSVDATGVSGKPMLLENIPALLNNNQFAPKDHFSWGP